MGKNKIKKMLPNIIRYGSFFILLFFISFTIAFSSLYYNYKNASSEVFERQNNNNKKDKEFKEVNGHNDKVYNETKDENQNKISNDKDKEIRDKEIKEMKLYEIENRRQIRQKLEGNKANYTEKSNFLNPYIVDGKKIAYLTFDDGPSVTATPFILDILKKYNIKVTFFVVGSMVYENKQLLVREKQEGHSIGNHTYTHNYKYLYSDVNNFLGEIKKTGELVKSVLNTEEDIKLIRFPGGSSGSSLSVYRKAAEENGYHYVDWNCLNGDAEASHVPAEKLISNIKQTSGGQQHIVILMHDAPGKETTVQALPAIIEYLQAQGYSFERLM